MTNRPRVGVGILIKKSGKYLLMKRKKVHGDGTWAPPGGRLELFETIEDCVKREAMEEVGVEVDGITLLSMLSPA